MKIAVLNCKPILKDGLAKFGQIEEITKDTPMESIKDFQGVFIDWEKEGETDVRTLLLQTEIAEFTIKSKIKTLIFDSHRVLEKKAISWLRKNNSIVFEPSIKPRNNVFYLPYPVSIPEDIDLLTYKTKSIDIGLPDSNFDEYIRYLRMIESTEKTYILEKDITDYNNIKTVLLLGSQYDYNNGYLPDISAMLDKYCVPLLPEKHRFYYSIFKDTLISKPKDFGFIVDTYEISYYGLLSDIYNNIKKLFPEMVVSNVAKRIVSILEES